MDYFRTGGPPTQLQDLLLLGPMGYLPSYRNLVGMRMRGTNGFCECNNG